jgi:hypothetical protein
MSYVSQHYSRHNYPAGIISLMSPGATTRAISAVNDALRQEYADNFVSLYLYGSVITGNYQIGQSDVNLLAVIENDIDINQLRDFLKPVWSDHGNVLRKIPKIGSRKSIDNYLAANPILAQHIALHSELVHGEPCLAEPPRVVFSEQLARIINLALHASAAIAPSLLPEKEATEASMNLRRLHNQLFRQNVGGDFQAPLLLSQVKQHINEELRSVRQQPWEDAPVQDAPPLISDLRAIYEVENRLVLVLPESDSELIAQRVLTIDWPAVANRVADQFRGIRIATARELRLMLQYENVSDLYLKSYDHAWGLDPLANIEVERWRIYRDLARMPAELLVGGLPNAYIVSEDSDISMLIHDFQNKLLNIQLRNELLGRLNFQPVTPPTPLPDIDEPIEQRISAMFNHLEWWTSQYLTSMKSTQTAGADNLPV